MSPVGEGEDSFIAYTRSDRVPSFIQLGQQLGVLDLGAEVDACVYEEMRQCR